jgi:hypothetical protein
MICSSSWVFNKKEKGNNDLYAQFQLKSRIAAEEIVNCVLFKFMQLGGKNLYKKQHQSMETETLVMLLFVCNRTDQGSIISDTKQMLETALEDIKENGMMLKEFKNKEIPYFMLRLITPCLPAATKPTNDKAYNHYKEQGKKAFHFEVAKKNVNYFKYISSHTYKLRLKMKYLGKFKDSLGPLGKIP